MSATWNPTVSAALETYLNGNKQVEGPAAANSSVSENLCDDGCLRFVIWFCAISPFPGSLF